MSINNNTGTDADTKTKTKTPAQKARETREANKARDGAVRASLFRFRDATLAAMVKRICTDAKFECACCGRTYPAGMAIGVDGIFDSGEGLIDDHAIYEAVDGHPEQAKQHIEGTQLTSKLDICPICYHTIVAPAVNSRIAAYLIPEAKNLINEIRAVGGRRPLTNKDWDSWDVDDDEEESTEADDAEADAEA